MRTAFACFIKQQERSQGYFLTGRPNIRASAPGIPLLPSPSVEMPRGLEKVTVSSEILSGWTLALLESSLSAGCLGSGLLHDKLVKYWLKGT